MHTIDTGSHDPYYNQAFEEYVFKTYRDDDIFYLWRNNPAVIVGSFQNIYREVNVPLLRRLGIPVIRRISGGGTVYHDLGNINYTYITESSGRIDYDRCLVPVLTALNSLGIPAEKGRSCDIVVEGRKISGSAQRTAGNRLLHHGTLLFQSNLALLDYVTAQSKNKSVTTVGTASAICKVTNICEYLSVPMTIEEFQAALLAQVIAPHTNRIVLGAAQQAAICQLRDEKYKSWEWTWGRNPVFTYEKEGTFAGVPIVVHYAAKCGIVTEVELDCAVLDCANVAEMLLGTRLDPECLYTLCRTFAPGREEELIEYFM